MLVQLQVSCAFWFAICLSTKNEEIAITYTIAWKFLKSLHAQLSKFITHQDLRTLSEQMV